MTTEIITTLLATPGAILLAGVTYWFTKKREHAAELRKEKLELYKDFAATFSAVISNEKTPEEQRTFAHACNKLNLIAPQVVVKALQNFQQPQDNKDRSQLISEMFHEIRKDLQVMPKDKDPSFTFRFWESHAPLTKNEP